MRRGKNIPIILVLCMLIYAPISSSVKERESSTETIEGAYIVAVGPPGVEKIEDCIRTQRFSQSELYELINRLSNLNYSEDIYEILEDKLDILIEYGLLPPEFTMDNIKLKLPVSVSDKTQSLKPPSPYFVHHISIGPHIYLRYSFLFRNAYINFPLYLMKDNPYLLNKFIIKPPVLPNYSFLENISGVCRVGEFIPAQIIISPPPTVYISAGLYGLPEQAFLIKGSFLGMYLMKVGLISLYVYYDGGTPDLLIPLADLEIGLSLVSIQIEIKDYAIIEVIINGVVNLPT